MGSADELIATVLDLVGTAYEAAAEPERWSDFPAAFADATRPERTLIGPQAAGDPGAEVDSDAAYSMHAPTAPGGLSVKRGGAVAALSTAPLEREGAVAERELRLMQLLIPHLLRASLLQKRLAGAQAQHASIKAALDAVHGAVWIFGTEGRLLHANRAGHELHRRRDGIWIGSDGRPTTAHRDDQRKLLHAISRTVDEGLRCTVDGAQPVWVRRRRSDVALRVAVYPLRREGMPHAGAAVVFVTDPSRRNEQPVDGLRALFGLTATEARLAASLTRGDSLEDYCKAHGVSRNTARTHLRHLCFKTGTHRQAELVSVLAGVASNDTSRHYPKS